MGVWQRELITGLLLFLALLVVGGMTGLFMPLALLLTVVILMRQLFQINRFEKWIRAGGRAKYPKTYGVWEEIYYHVYRIKKNERKRKKKLSKMVDQFRQSTEALPDAAVVLGANDEIEWANKAAREVFGLQQSDKGQRIPNLIRFPEFIRYLKSGNYNEAVILPSPINNRITLAVRIITYGAGLRLLLAQDVTELKKMERMRKDFVANVSHELRTPLTVLKGYLETLQDMDDGESPLLTTSFQQMQGQTERMQHLVDDLLLLTRLETQQKKTECVNVPALLNQICKEAETMKGNASAPRLQPVGGCPSARIQLSLETDAHIVGEEQELRSAFTNLLGNALKYSAEDSVVKVRWHRSKDSIVLDVEDQGEGIAAVDIPRVTERFYRSEVKRAKKVGGTGLGLAIVKHVLMRHDAKLSIVSELGKGSCFSCHFPLKRVCN
ncbi:MAG: phosphate regulon sensor histidine kinase PhoR [Methylobacter tundripaludum]|mgnify:CR=1 FL=1|uniref:Phosphate regulon sensor protein PhoR n=1 Tax=Methylobacter tundripaludum TaxID=173365 RepID=A0A2S6H448_9GAMM|nr:phosphate regulon sensor histidine kinase PhoR [Methylobacter tundripaludum]MCF7964249.1 phosphate regulon sensor histidine kinase PhoR [Methylobacter tundripaludum]MCK9636759.1 phosphate regulon sensor histidine kinase PhoR [Methylobacter tundripaludum]PPK72262.1 PAS/PAC sensor signal transduction histidine kinase [Methylobacter tundripaludum]